MFDKDVPFEHAMIFWMKHLFQKDKLHTPAIYMVMENVEMSGSFIASRLSTLLNVY